MKRRKFIGLLAFVVSLPNLAFSSIKITPQANRVVNDFLLELGNGFYDSTTNYKVAQQVGRELGLRSCDMGEICSETFKLEHEHSFINRHDMHSRLINLIMSDFEENKIFRCCGWIMSQTEAKLIWLLNESKRQENLTPLAIFS